MLAAVLTLGCSLKFWHLCTRSSLIHPPTVPTLDRLLLSEDSARFFQSILRQFNTCVFRFLCAEQREQTIEQKYDCSTSVLREKQLTTVHTDKDRRWLKKSEDRTMHPQQPYGNTSSRGFNFPNAPWMAPMMNNNMNMSMHMPMGMSQPFPQFVQHANFHQGRNRTPSGRMHRQEGNQYTPQHNQPYPQQRFNDREKKLKYVDHAVGVCR
jgi:hypothetical protein